ncbi:MAG TPA: hypothetical protein VMU89_14475 [Thermomicrobiaceae bacterium]|nr:hypothetical protein [Thermomicrobiaceae bacterium]
MTTTVVECVRFRVRAGADRAMVVVAAARSTAFLGRQAGFVA